MKTVKLTKTELHMLGEACRDFENGMVDGFQDNGAYTKTEVKAYYKAREKLFDAHSVAIDEVW